jgi:hypothetical protein
MVRQGGVGAEVLRWGRVVKKGIGVEGRSEVAAWEGKVGMGKWGRVVVEGQVVGVDGERYSIGGVGSEGRGK